MTMSRPQRNAGSLVLILILGSLWGLAAPAKAVEGEVWASAQAVPEASGTMPVVESLEDLARLSKAELEWLYRHSPPAGMPAGKAKGMPLVMSGTKWAVPASRAGRVLWQGKVFRPDASDAINRFAGLRMIRGELSYGSSWLDGGPALILDYERTSKVYRRYRDEIREVAPGLLLGLMYERTEPLPTQVRYFALDTRGR